MKKYILLLFIPFIFAASIQDMHRAVIAKKNTSSCSFSALSCTDLTASQDFSGAGYTQFFYQFVNNGDSITICNIDMRLRMDNTGSVDAHLEVWDTSHTGQIGGDSETVVLTNTSFQIIPFVWNSNKPTPTGDFSIQVHFDEYTGDVLNMQASTKISPTCHSDTNYDAHKKDDTDVDQDYYFVVYTE